MAKKKFPEVQEPKAEGSLNLKEKTANFSGRIFGIIKFILGICLLPFVYGVSRAFLAEFSFAQLTLQNYFWYGLITFVIIYLFVLEPAIIYAKGQKIMEVVFTFFKPLVKVAPYLLPIYFILLCIVYAILAALSKTEGMIQVFFFLFGFSIGLHLIFGAKSLRSKQADFLKGNYIFGFSFVYILNLMLLAFVFSLIIDKFSFVNFCNSAYQAASNIFAAIFKQLFLNKRG